MSATVHSLPKALSSKQPRAKSRRMIVAERRQRAAASAIGAIGIVLTALSLTHLSNGVALVTHVGGWQSWAMAIGIDLGFIALECAQICAATDAMRKVVTRYARPSIIGTLAGSAVMNAFAFASAARGVWIAPAIALGVAIPALIYVLTRISVAMLIDVRK